MKVRISKSGKFSKTIKYLGDLSEFSNKINWDRYGELGVKALKNNTPKDTGKTAESWYYRIVKNKNSISIEWYNTNFNDGVNIAVIIHHGHGTKNGGYVKGVNYINPAMKPIFENLLHEVLEEVKFK